MTHEIKHSPPPWSIGLDKFGRPTYIKADGNRIAQTLSTPETKTAEKRIANAEHIVKCVNENESLHARIKELECKPVFRVSKDEHKTYLYVDDHLAAMQKGHGIDRLPEFISECGGDIKDYIKVKSELKELENERT